MAEGGFEAYDLNAAERRAVRTRFLLVQIVWIVPVAFGIVMVGRLICRHRPSA